MIGKNTNDWIYDKHAVITGASDGIGKELSKNLVGKCRRISLIDKDSEKLHLLEKELKLIDSNLITKLEGYSMDVRDKCHLNTFFNKIYQVDNDSIDMFINCAGGSHVIDLFENMNYDDIEQIFDTNAKAPIFWLRGILPYMKNNKMRNGDLKRGHIIMMSSRSAERPLPRLSVYASAKGAVEKLIEALQREYAKKSIVFTIVNPGSINTSFTKNWEAKDKDSHNLESMNVYEAVSPILQALSAQYATNRVSYESTTQWHDELGVLK